MTTTTEVAQADRNAAADWFRDCMADAGLARSVERGGNDNMLVQAFARHRAQALAQGRLEGVKAGLEAATQVCASQRSEAKAFGQTQAEFWSLQLYKQIRNLSTQTIAQITQETPE